MEEAVLWPLSLKQLEANTITGPPGDQLEHILLAGSDRGMLRHILECVHFDLVFGDYRKASGASHERHHCTAS